MPTGSSTRALPTYFICHGGGPWHVMGGHWATAHAGLRAALQTMSAEMQALKPRAVLLVSAHWEATEFRVQGQAKPGLLFDYGGFPPEAYCLRYAARGAPAIAAQLQTLLREAGHSCELESRRGYDHGAFVPMAVLWPDADVPLLQLSLKAGLDAGTHLQVGRILASLRHAGILIIASGSSWHNLQQLGEPAHLPSQEWDGWLDRALTACTGAARSRALLDWRNAPHARLAHPREEHLLPLMVAVGAAEAEAGHCNYRESRVFGGPTLSGYRFG